MKSVIEFLYEQQLLFELSKSTIKTVKLNQPKTLKKRSIDTSQKHLAFINGVKKLVSSGKISPEVGNKMKKRVSEKFKEEQAALNPIPEKSSKPSETPTKKPIKEQLLSPYDKRTGETIW